MLKYMNILEKIKVKVKIKYDIVLYSKIIGISKG